MENPPKTNEPQGRFLGLSARVWAGIWLLVSLIVLLRPTARVMGVEMSRRSGVNMVAVVNHFFGSAMMACGLLALACTLLLLFLPRSRVLWVCSFILLLAEEGARWLSRLHLEGALKGWIPS
jgi:hypothetical protein